MQALERNSATTSETKSGNPLRVFLVEDSPVIRERLAESISALAHVAVVGTADSEGEAIGALQETACDAVVLDLQLKQGHGFNVLKAVRRPPERPRLTVIVLSNFSSSQYRDRSLELGADYFFDKAREYDRVCDVLEKLARTQGQNLS